MRSIKTNTIFLNLLIIIFVFQPALQLVFPIFTYADEFIAMLAFPLMIFRIGKNKFRITISKDDKHLALFLLLIFAIGIISNVRSGIQTYKYIFGDVLIFFKFFLIYYLTRTSMKGASPSKGLLRLIIVFLIIGTIYDYATATNVTSYLRYGFKSNYFIYGNPTGLLAISSFTLCMYLLINKKFDFFVILISIVILSTLRFKAFVFLAFIFIMYFYTIKLNKKISISKFLVFGIVGFIIAYSQIEFYFISSVDTTARGQLLTKSLQIMKDYFPLGTGFGTFGSYMSGLNYSSLYYTYNLNNIYGLGPTFTAYLSDSFWPMIIAQFGLFGIVLYFLCIKNLFDKIQQTYKKKENNYIYFCKILALLYLLISSITESAFVNPVCVCFAIIIGLEMNNDVEKA